MKRECNAKAGIEKRKGILLVALLARQKSAKVKFLMRYFKVLK
jgi:hypothetical protein